MEKREYVWVPRPDDDEREGSYLFYNRLDEASRILLPKPELDRIFVSSGVIERLKEHTDDYITFLVTAFFDSDRLIHIDESVRIVPWKDITIGNSAMLIDIVIEQ